LQDELTVDEYTSIMNFNTEDLVECRLRALDNIKENKSRVARYYHKKVKPMVFQEGELVWELVLPVGV
jgi:hypothetical protein